MFGGIVWVWCVHSGQCVCKERVPFKVLCVWEGGGSTLLHSAGGKLLSLSFGGATICISCHPPFSFFSRCLRSRTEAAGSFELRGNQ